MEILPGMEGGNVYDQLLPKTKGVNATGGGPTDSAYSVTIGTGNGNMTGIAAPTGADLTSGVKLPWAVCPSNADANLGDGTGKATYRVNGGVPSTVVRSPKKMVVSVSRRKMDSRAIQTVLLKPS